jgi:hypothetical protein
MNATVSALLRQASAKVAELLAEGRDSEVGGVLERLRAEAEAAIKARLKATRTKDRRR